MVFEGTVGGWRIIEEGQPPVMIHATVEDMQRLKESNARKVHEAGTTSELSYHGGVSGIGVETHPKLYLILWGSQWNNNDPSGEAALLESFYNGAGGSSWLNSVTQYCQGVASGTVFCTVLVLPLAIRKAFSRQCGPTMAVPRPRARASRNSLRRRSKLLSTSATPAAPAMPLCNT